MADEPKSDDLSMIGYPSKAQVEHAIAKVRERGEQPTPALIADAIRDGCGMRPGDDVTAKLLEYYELAP